MHPIFADIVAVVHVVFVAFLVIGVLFIAVGQALGWRCIAIGWFRMSHLVAAIYTAARAWLGQPCPLTALENAWRGPRPPANSFIRGCHAFYFRGVDHQRFTISSTVFAAIVLALFVLTFVMSRLHPKD